MALLKPNNVKDAGKALELIGKGTGYKDLKAIGAIILGLGLLFAFLRAVGVL